MASSELRLKVSEAKVLETIDNLSKSIDSMQSNLDKLIAKRQKIETSYTGKTASEAIEVIKENEANAKKAIEKTIKQKEKLQQYIENMNSTDSSISSSFNEALNEARNIFK